MKNGFTLIELLAVIVIISLLTALAVPNIVKIKQNINEREYNNKVKMIVSAAEIYATNNINSLFKTSDISTVSVDTLIKDGILSKEDCTGVSSSSTYGCIINPKDNTVMNNDCVKLTKKNNIISGKYLINCSE